MQVSLVAAVCIMIREGNYQKTTAIDSAEPSRRDTQDITIKCVLKWGYGMKQTYLQWIAV